MWGRQRRTAGRGWSHDLLKPICVLAENRKGEKSIYIFFYSSRSRSRRVSFFFFKSAVLRCEWRPLVKSVSTSGLTPCPLEPFWWHAWSAASGNHSCGSTCPGSIPSHSFSLFQILILQEQLSLELSVIYGKKISRIFLFKNKDKTNSFCSNYAAPTALVNSETIFSLISTQPWDKIGVIVFTT